VAEKERAPVNSSVTRDFKVAGYAICGWAEAELQPFLSND
jgi:hypothetical protein